MSIRTFAKSVGISHSLLGKTKALGSDKLEKILSTYPDLNPAWLLTGKGEMLEKKSEENVRAKMSGQNVRTKEQNVRAKRPDKDFGTVPDDAAPKYRVTAIHPDQGTAYELPEQTSMLEEPGAAYITAKRVPPPAPHLTGDFAAADSEPMDVEVYKALLEAKDEIIATKDAQIADLRGSMEDMRKGTEDLRRSIDNLEDAIEALQRASKGAPVVRDAGGAAAHRK